MQSTIYDYDIDALTKELQKILRIQDLDIVVHCVTATDMLESGYDANTEGLCTRDRKHGDALIEINVDHKGNKTVFESDIYNDGWLSTLIHELFHVVIGELADQADTMLEYITDKTANDSLDNELDVKREHLVCHLTKIMLNTLSSEELLNKYKKGNQDGSGSEKTQ
jgi:hypothetical protein